MTTYFLRIYEKTEMLGDRLNQIFKFISPSYCVTASIYFDTAGEGMALTRNATTGDGLDLSDDPWDIKNNLGDIIILLVHGVFWTFVLIYIELKDKGKEPLGCLQPKCCK